MMRKRKEERKKKKEKKENEKGKCKIKKRLAGLAGWLATRGAADTRRRTRTRLNSRLIRVGFKTTKYMDSVGGQVSSWE